MTSWETCACFYMSWHIFLTVVQKAVERADTRATTHEQDLGICGLRTQLRKRETLHLMLLLFSGSSWIAGEGKIACTTEMIVWCQKEKTHLMLVVHSQRLTLGVQGDLCDQWKEESHHLPSEGGQICPNCCSENVFLLRTKACQSDHVPL